MSELSAVIEGECLTPVRRERCEYRRDGVSDGCGSFAGRSDGDEKTRVSFVESEYSLSVGSKEHEIGLPVTWEVSMIGIEWTFRQRTSELDE